MRDQVSPSHMPVFGIPERRKMNGVRGAVLPNGVPKPLLASFLVSSCLVASICYRFFTNEGGKSPEELQALRTGSQREIQEAERARARSERLARGESQ